MGELTFWEKLLQLRYLPFQLLYWWKQARCEHDFNFEEKEKGWFTTGSLTFHVMCSKCDKSEMIRMKFPKQKDA